MTATALACFERCLNREYSPQRCPSESDFYALWEQRELSSLPPCECAIVGAMLADRLPWVFAAGYQATLRNAFASLPAGGWAAFAATEDTRSPSEYPGTELMPAELGFRLNGNKSWIAHSKCVDHLIVTVNDPGGDKYRARGTIIASDAEGVMLTHRDRPRFLGAMSQGFAHFDNTPVATDAVFEFEPIRQFGRTEAKFVMLACVSFMVVQLGEKYPLRERLLTLAGALLTLLAEQETSRQLYAVLDRYYQSCVHDFERSAAAERIPQFENDKQLFRMYTARIQRRGEFARKS